jgi:hypothetical protein
MPTTKSLRMAMAVLVVTSASRSSDRPAVTMLLELSRVSCPWELELPITAAAAAATLRQCSALVRNGPVWTVAPVWRAVAAPPPSMVRDKKLLWYWRRRLVVAPQPQQPVLEFTASGWDEPIPRVSVICLTPRAAFLRLGLSRCPCPSPFPPPWTMEYCESRNSIQAAARVAVLPKMY